MNNEPVGNMCIGCGSSWSDKRLEIERRLRPNLISCCPDRKVVAVYAHPVKELTDEEILISAQYNGIRASEILDEYVIDFAKAILRKAQE